MAYNVIQRHCNAPPCPAEQVITPDHRLENVAAAHTQEGGGLRVTLRNEYAGTLPSTYNVTMARHPRCTMASQTFV